MRPIPDNLLVSILTYLESEDNFVFLETSKNSAGEQTSFIFHKPLTLLAFHRDDSLNHFFDQAGAYLGRGYFLAGWFSYEFGYSLEPACKRYLKDISRQTALAIIGVFPSPIVYNHITGECTPSLPRQKSPNTRKSGCEITNLRPGMSRAAFILALAKIREYIRAGDTYQVNYTLKYLFDCNGSPAELYKKLRLGQTVAYSAWLKLANQDILSFSPELFFRKKTNLIRVKPMKGTMARGRTRKEDLQMAEILGADGKNRSENVMIVDLLRNDLGRLCEAGSVQTSAMFEVETFASLHQMTSTVTGRLMAQISLRQIFQALFPCGSVTGAPKVRTMEIIKELETGPRGVYTGAIGYISPDGDAVFNVPIRTVVLEDGHGEMGIGAGITYGSDPDAEWRESLLKGQFLSRPQADFGLIETMLWQPGKDFWLLDQHLNRLDDSAQYFAYPCSKKDLAGQLEVLATQWRLISHTALRVRVLLSRSGETTINQTACEMPAAMDLPGTNTGQLPRITVSRHRTDPANTLLFHKTTSRDLYNRERQKAGENGFFEVIFRNSRDEITEGAISNIIIRKDGYFYTPPQASGLLAGVGRACLMNKGRLREKILYLDDLEDAEAVYLVNSVRGVIEVCLFRG